MTSLTPVEYLSVLLTSPSFLSPRIPVGPSVGSTRVRPRTFWGVREVLVSYGTTMGQGKSELSVSSSVDRRDTRHRRRRLWTETLPENRRGRKTQCSKVKSEPSTQTTRI